MNRVSEPQQAAFALTELRCTFGGRSLVPDIAVFAWENIPLDETGDIGDRFSIPPDWTIEILSPQQPQTRVIDNILFCLNSGTELGWLIDPDETTILVFRAGEQPQLKRNNDKLPSLSHLSGWEISVNQVFNLLNFRSPIQGA
ncbi:MAG: Uma2 family endonuclease [Phormidium sp.]